MLSAGTSTYQYNGDGVLVQAVELNNPTTYVQDTQSGLSQILAMTTNGATTNALYGHQRLATVTGGAYTWLLHDRLGSTRMELDSAGVPLAVPTYDPWGQRTTSGSTPFGFTGELQNPTTGLIHLRARWYHPGTGTLLGRDPFSGYQDRPYSLHPYQYAYSQPTLYTDPSGLCVPPFQPSPLVCPPVPPDYVTPVDPGEQSYLPFEPLACFTPPIQKADYSRYDRVLAYIYSEMSTNSTSSIVAEMRNYLTASEVSSPGASVSPIYIDKLAHAVRISKALELFYHQVKAESAWDHKPFLLRQYGFNDDPYAPVRDDPVITREIFFDIWSNIHYGYVGMAAGFTRFILLQAQNATIIPGVGDNDEGDTLSVSIGIDLWEQHGYSLTKDDLHGAILNHLDTYTELGVRSKESNKIQYSYTPR